jgi:hypothetical protein
MQCENCGSDVHGELNVFSSYSADEDLHVIEITQDERDWICCDLCNKIFCFRCCTYPRTGYCDACIEAANLRDYLIKIGLIS